MRRGEIWWAELPPPVGTRPVLLLSRDEAYSIRQLITVAPVSTRSRSIPSEVELGTEDGLPQRCAVNLDTITTVPKSTLSRKVAALSYQKLEAVEAALHFALGLKE